MERDHEVGLVGKGSGELGIGTQDIVDLGVERVHGALTQLCLYVSRLARQRGLHPGHVQPPRGGEG